MVDIPGIMMRTDTIKTIDDLLAYAEDRGKKQVEKFGSHSPMLIGMSNEDLAIFDLSGFKLPDQQLEASKSCRSVINKLGLGMCCFVIQSLALELPNTEEARKLADKYASGELKIIDHPDKKFMVQFFLQRPGKVRVINYTLVKNESGTTLQDRREIDAKSGYNIFDFYDHSRVN